MNRIDAMLQPGERVMWRLDQRARAGPIWAYLLAAGVPLTVIAVIGTTILWHVRVPAGPLVLLVGLLMFLPFFSLFVAWASEWLPKAIAITERRVLMAGSRQSSCRELARAEILRVELIGAFGFVDLQLADGTVRRLRGIENAENFLRALDVPGRIWRRRPRPSRPFTALFLLLLAYPIPTAIVKLTKAGFVYVQGNPPTGAIETTLLLLAQLGLCFAATHVLFIASHQFALRRLPADEGQRYRCWHLDPRCRGIPDDPAIELPLWARLGDWLSTSFARQAFGGPVECDCAPEIIGGED